MKLSIVARRIIPVALLAAGILLAGCGEKVSKTAPASPAPAPAETSESHLEAPDTKDASNEFTLADLEGYLPSDPIDSVELTKAEKELLNQAMHHSGGETKTSTSFAFQKPVRVQADGAPIKVDQPGYACPTVADVDEDGKLDLVVGQFDGGKMRFFKNVSKESNGFELAAEQWIKTDGNVAEVPGVW